VSNYSPWYESYSKRSFSYTNVLFHYLFDLKNWTYYGRINFLPRLNRKGEKSINVILVTLGGLDPIHFCLFTLRKDLILQWTSKSWIETNSEVNFSKMAVQWYYLSKMWTSESINTGLDYKFAIAKILFIIIYS
jgi:hypothetical protein